MVLRLGHAPHACASSARLRKLACNVCPLAHARGSVLSAACTEPRPWFAKRQGADADFRNLSLALIDVNLWGGTWLSASGGVRFDCLAEPARARFSRGLSHNPSGGRVSRAGSSEPYWRAHRL